MVSIAVRGLELDDLPRMVRRVRRIAGLSQRGLADRLDVSQSTVAKWETGRNHLSGEQLIELLSLVGLSLVVRTPDDRPVRPMSQFAERDRGDRRFPAYAQVDAVTTWEFEDPCRTVGPYDDVRFGLPRPQFSRMRASRVNDPRSATDDQPSRAELIERLPPRLQARTRLGREIRATMLPIWARNGQLALMLANPPRWSATRTSYRNPAGSGPQGWGKLLSEYAADSERRSPEALPGAGRGLGGVTERYGRWNPAPEGAGDLEGPGDGPPVHDVR